MLLYFLPESPRWLILNNKTKQAEKIIREACHYNKSRLPSDLGLVRHAEKKKWMKHNEKPSYFHLFRSSELRFRNVVLFIVWVIQKNIFQNSRFQYSDSNCSGLLRNGYCIVRSVITRKVGRTLSEKFYRNQKLCFRRVFDGNFFLNNAMAGAIELPTLVFCVFLLRMGRKR